MLGKSVGFVDGNSVLVVARGDWKATAFIAVVFGFKGIICQKQRGLVDIAPTFFAVAREGEWLDCST